MASHRENSELRIRKTAGSKQKIKEKVGWWSGGYRLRINSVVIMATKYL